MIDYFGAFACCCCFKHTYCYCLGTTGFKQKTDFSKTGDKHCISVQQMSFQTSEACADPSCSISNIGYLYFYLHWRCLLPISLKVDDREVRYHLGKVPGLVYFVCFRP